MTEKALPAVWTPPVWDADRITLVQKIICPPSASTADFEYFVAWCQRTGLDPFVKQAYLVERRSKGENGQWNTRHEPMAAEAGMAAVADAQADFEGVAGAAVYEGDAFEIDEATQTVRTHVWSETVRAKHGHKLVGAWAHARRRGRITPIVWLRVEQRIQTRWDSEARKNVPTSFWAKDPAGMISKCARAMAYRLCYPNLFSGVPIREEIDADDAREEAAPRPTLPESHAGLSRLSAKLGITPRTSAAASVERPGDAQPETVATEEVVSPSTPPSRGTPASGIITFGPSKGTPIAGATLVELEDSIQVGEEKIAESPAARWVPTTRVCLEEMRAEVHRRLNELK